MCNTSLPVYKMNDGGKASAWSFVLSSSDSITKWNYNNRFKWLLIPQKDFNTVTTRSRWLGLGFGFFLFWFFGFSNWGIHISIKRNSLDSKEWAKLFLSPGRKHLLNSKLSLVRGIICILYLQLSFAQFVYDSTSSTSQSTYKNKLEKWTHRTSEVKLLKSRHAEQRAGEDFHARSHLSLLSEYDR